MNKCCIVLGMHRTASSLLAKGLKQAGVNMGDVLLGPGCGNPAGHFEDKSFLNMNELLLHSAGGTWDNPPPEKAIIEAGKFFSKEIKELIKNKNKTALWGWKDPRTILTIKCYMPYLDDPCFFVCLRKPEMIAKSLKRRDELLGQGIATSIKFGIELAAIYHERLMGFLAEYDALPEKARS